MEFLESFLNRCPLLLYCHSFAAGVLVCGFENGQTVASAARGLNWHHPMLCTMVILFHFDCPANDRCVKVSPMRIALPDGRGSLTRRIDEAETSDPESLDDFGSFGYLRGTRDRSVMLELRQKNGNVMAVGYSWLERAEFNPSTGITLHVTGQTIRLTGRNLNAESRPNVRLFQALTRHRVPWIQEADEATAMTTETGAVLIEKITW